MSEKGKEALHKAKVAVGVEDRTVSEKVSDAADAAIAVSREKAIEAGHAASEYANDFATEMQTTAPSSVEETKQMAANAAEAAREKAVELGKTIAEQSSDFVDDTQLPSGDEIKETMQEIKDSVKEEVQQDVDRIEDAVKG